MSTGLSPLFTRRTYNAVEHESLRAVMRSMFVHFGARDAYRRTSELLNYMNARYVSDLSPAGANYCRKQLERMLPDVAI